MDLVSSVLKNHFRRRLRSSCQQSQLYPSCFVQPYLQLMCPCRGNGYQPPAMPVSLMSSSPVLQLQHWSKLFCEKSMGWVGLRVLGVLSPVKLPENPSVVPFVTLGLPTLSTDYGVFVTNRPWWQNKFSHAKLWELTGREQSFNWLSFPSLSLLILLLQSLLLFRWQACGL